MTNSTKQWFFNLWAPHYDLWLTSIFYQAVHRRLLEFVEFPPSPRVLDLGCGTGRLLHRLAFQFLTLRGVGLDFSNEMIRQARRQNQYPDRITFQAGNAEALPFATSEFDAVFCTISFLHYLHPQQVCLQVARVLSPGGRFYLVDYTTPEGLGGGQFPLIGELRFYSRSQREDLAIASGFHTVSHHYLLGPVLLTIFSR